MHTESRKRRRLRAGLSVVLVTGLASCAADHQSPEPARSILPIDVTNSAGRSGAFYEPAGLPLESVPVLVLLHPTGSNGPAFIPAFQSLADSIGFLIVAPESRLSPDGQATWQVGDRPREVTEDMEHVLAALEWVRRTTLLDFAEERVLVAGFSGGASSAPYLATNRPPFSHAAVLHGRAFPAGFGPRAVPMWLSTGDEDALATTPQLRSLAADLSADGHDVTVRTYPIGHTLSEQEKRDLIEWWIGG